MTGAIPWLMLCVAVIGLLYTIRNRRKDEEATALKAALAPIIDQLASHGASISAHSITLSTMAKEQAQLNQRLESHEEQDNERYERIEEMHREIRGDIKLLLERH